MTNRDYKFSINKLFKRTKMKFQSSSTSFPKVYGFDSSLNQYLTNNDLHDLLMNEEPIWLLGKEYSSICQLNDLQDDFRSKIWITYRKNFASIGGNGPTSDQGWGCMIRVAQMTLAQALVLSYLGREWKWIGCEKYFTEENKIKMDFDEINLNTGNNLNDAKLTDFIRKNEQECLDYIKSNQEHEIYIRILKEFQDKKTSQYSIHQIALMGATEDKPVGTWFGPNTIAQTLRLALEFAKFLVLFKSLFILFFTNLNLGNFQALIIQIISQFMLR